MNQFLSFGKLVIKEFQSLPNLLIYEQTKHATGYRYLKATDA